MSSDLTTAGGTIAGTSGKWTITSGGIFQPVADNTNDIGSTSLRVKDIWINGRLKNQTSGGDAFSFLMGAAGTTLVFVSEAVTGSPASFTFSFASLTAGRTWSFPDGTTTLVGTDTVQTLTNKTLTSPTLTTPSLGVASATSVAQSGTRKRVSTQFDATTTTLGDVTGLSATLTAGLTYAFRATLHISADAVGGHKYAMAGTCTATAIIYQVNAINNGTNAFRINSRQTALGGSVGEAVGTAYFTQIFGTITVNAGGTLTVQFAQNAANGTSSILVGSTLELEIIS